MRGLCPGIRRQVSTAQRYDNRALIGSFPGNLSRATRGCLEEGQLPLPKRRFRGRGKRTLSQDLGLLNMESNLFTCYLAFSLGRSPLGAPLNIFVNSTSVFFLLWITFLGLPWST